MKRYRYPLFRPLLQFLHIFIVYAGMFLSGSSVVTLAAVNSFAETISADQLQAQGQEEFLRGDFEMAANHWQEAVNTYKKTGMTDEEINTLILLTDAYQALGLHPRALEYLDRAQKLAVATNSNKEHLAAISIGQGNSYFYMGYTKESRDYFEKSLAIARETEETELEAVCYNNLGNLLNVQHEYGEALDAYDKCIKLAKSTDNQKVVVNAMINAAKTAALWNNPKEVESYLIPALNQARKLDDSYEKAYGLAALGQIAWEISSRNSDTTSSRWWGIAYQTLTGASDTADKLGNHRAKSFSLGYLARMYESENRYEDALELTRQAVFAAQQANAPEILYLWQWQNGRLLKAKGEMDEAIIAYHSAIRNLEIVRQDISVTCQVSNISFREKEGRLYLELADLLIKHAESQTYPVEIQATLREVRDTIELLRAAELRDYFQDQCVTALQKDEIQIEHLQVIAQHTAVIYSIIYPERLELLLELPDNIMRRFVVKVSSGELKKEARFFRRALEGIWPDYQAKAQKFYNWLIRPLEEELTAQKIDTLVFVPDGALRNIPMAALHDGSHFLVNKYALAIMPGRLTFITPKTSKHKREWPLLGGLTHSEENVNSLPKVAEELESIQKMYGGIRLLNEEFTIENMEKELRSGPYTIVHMATHGEFQDNVRKSYLLTHDGKMTMNDLERLVGLVRFRDVPIELLTLSACETAAGDDRAAMGLAGVAVKSGASSAVATLWSVGDEAASLLIPNFYNNLKNSKISKAEALRQAQLKMLNHKRYVHPGFWSSFLLTGNWL